MVITLELPVKAVPDAQRRMMYTASFSFRLTSLISLEITLV